MFDSRVGVWFVGARGAVAATATLGLVALAKRLIGNVGLVSTLPQFENLELVGWENLVVGGHEVRQGTSAQTLEELCGNGQTFDRTLVDECRSELQVTDRRIRWGTVANCGATITQLADGPLGEFQVESPRQTINRLQTDLRDFQQETGVQRVVVVYLASTEPTLPDPPLPESWPELEAALDSASAVHLPASSLYAIAALDLGMPFINFTPSPGSTPTAICELAEMRRTCHAGCDGKTGETLLKSVLAPMFTARNLEVMSWIGHNIFGNRDAEVLDDPANKSSKLRNKDWLLGRLLSGQPQTLASIEYVKSLGDWKTAWDHVHFRGFLGTPMKLQFTWQGCDSLLAAPLVLDLVRFVELSSRRGETGVLSYLCSFFKAPMGTQEHAFARQFLMLERWAAGVQKEPTLSVPR